MTSRGRSKVLLRSAYWKIKELSDLLKKIKTENIRTVNMRNKRRMEKVTVRIPKLL